MSDKPDNGFDKLLADLMQRVTRGAEDPVRKKKLELMKAGAKFLSDLIQAAGVSKLEPTSLFMVTTHLMAILMEHTEVSIGELIDETIRLCNTPATMERLQIAMKCADWPMAEEGKTCPDCGVVHGKPGQPKSPEDPPKAN